MTKTTWDKLDELADWHATFPGKDAQTVCKLWGECDKQLAAEKARSDELKKELSGKRDELNAWQLAFGSSQLTHALGAFESASGRADRAEAEVRELKQEIALERRSCRRAEAACAEMRDAIREACDHGITHAVGCSHAPETCSCHKAKLKRALSSDVGIGWLSPEVAQKVRAKIEELAEYAFASERRRAEEALALLTQRP